ncbi:MULTISPECIES: DUF7144 family membrane protein [unclassified Gordonia (in: high G+C Gram-positive bacteria)]|uniref:DUF7144 family membrane protein n=1 Tax=unclassified Gordonia (in: high G+C Gram-positive bacteria) TaxID=2657482 RepID=UPI001FFF1CB6|nr:MULTISPECIES: hypothetical protein [unclassified Gordonia (in: high G+C Gram-positive bacteria)]UQE75218.1 hypothetical protein MYK68_00805 [Gordonia sp. PP30]
MTENYSTPAHAAESKPDNPWAGGITWAAAALLLVVGVLGFFQGIAAVANDDIAIVRVGDYIYGFNLTTWGWIHIVLGIIAVIVAVGMFMATTWARVCAIIIACLSIIANFLWLPYTPWWSVILIALDIIVIWAVANWSGKDI